MSALPKTRTVLVTGGAKRLGREIALTLAAGGWRVAVHYLHSREAALATASDCAELTPGAACFDADLSDESATRALLPSVIAQFGQLNAVVNSAAIFEHDSAASFGYSAMERHLRSNTGAAILLAQALHEHVVSRQATGAVVNLLDQKLWNLNPDFFSYTLSKAALAAANTMLALALSPQLRVVGVAPGLTLTSPMLSPEQFEARHKLSPLGHSSSAADVAATVKFALENASITGTTLLVDGGQHLMKFERDFSFM
jgi:NAD(P)-dependent dehydrogenase (short-subunit alcohol dehydrogenase family)